MQKIQCKECGYDNEPERVYCHNCGIKLDRSLLPTVDKAAVQKKQVKRKKSKESAAAVGEFFGSAFRALLYAFLMAGLIRAMLPPDDVPPLKDRIELDAPAILFDMDEATQSVSPAKLVYSEEQVNDYLQTAIRSKSEGPMAEYVKFVRVFASFEKNNATVTTEQSVFGYSFYASSAYYVTVKGGELKTRNLGGSFGRLHVPVHIMKYLDVVFDKVWETLKREGEMLARLRAIGVYDEKVVLISGGKK